MFQYILHAFGFTTSGVAGGSIAAATQSYIGNVAKNSLFAAAMSAGASPAAMTVGTLLSVFALW